VGRSHSADFVVDDPDVSREHFEVVHEGGAYRLYDLGSKNGLLINGAPADDHPLSPGDEVRAGATVLRFEA
jgi:pSer/pThr/pTyr-binding forkhead associated (FHA) protein